MTFKEIKEYVSHPQVYMFLFGIIATFLLVLIFLAGAAYSCDVGGGTLNRLTCIDIEIVKACEFEGKAFKLPDEIIDTTFIDIGDLI